MRGTPAERLCAGIDCRGDDECWPWVGGTRAGYGRIRVGGSKMTVHRIVWEVEHGPIPEGLVLDHACHDPATCEGGFDCPHRRCCNPRHLVLSTPSANTRRGKIVQQQLARTHCPHGHPYSGDNLYRWRNIRYCRACNSGRKGVPGGCAVCMGNRR